MATSFSNDGNISLDILDEIKPWTLSFVLHLKQFPAVNSKEYLFDMYNSTYGYLMRVYIEYEAQTKATSLVFLVMYDDWAGNSFVYTKEWHINENILNPHLWTIVYNGGGYTTWSNTEAFIDGVFHDAHSHTWNISGTPSTSPGSPIVNVYIGDTDMNFSMSDIIIDEAAWPYTTIRLMAETYFGMSMRDHNIRQLPSSAHIYTLGNTTPYTSEVRTLWKNGNVLFTYPNMLWRGDVPYGEYLSVNNLQYVNGGSDVDIPYYMTRFGGASGIRGLTNLQQEWGINEWIWGLWGDQLTFAFLIRPISITTSTANEDRTLFYTYEDNVVTNKHLRVFMHAVGADLVLTLEYIRDTNTGTIQWTLPGLASSTTGELIVITHKGTPYEVNGTNTKLQLWDGSILEDSTSSVGTFNNAVDATFDHIVINSQDNTLNNGISLNEFDLAYFMTFEHELDGTEINQLISYIRERDSIVTEGLESTSVTDSNQHAANLHRTMTESVVLTEATLAEVFIARTVFEAITATMASSIEVRTIMKESITMSTTANTSFTYSNTINEQVQILDDLDFIINLVIQELIAAYDSNSHYKDVVQSVTETILSSDTISSKYTALILIAESINAVAESYKYLSVSIQEQISFVDTISAGYLYAQNLLENIIAISTASHTYQINLLASEQVIGDASVITRSDFFNLVVSEKIAFSSFLYDDEEDKRFYTISTNTKTFGSTEYLSYNFNSISDGYAASDHGVYKLNGSLDVTEVIKTSIKTGMIDFGSSSHKQISDVYLGITNNDDLILKVTTILGGQKVTRAYKLGLTTEEMDTKRLKLAKGVKSRFWQFELTNLEEVDFNLETIEVVPLMLRRRL